MYIDWKIIIGKYLKILLSSFISGLIIGISGIILLYSNQIIISNINGLMYLLSSISLLLICLYGYNFFLFKICYLFENFKANIFETFLTLLGNLGGLFLIMLPFRFIDVNNEFLNSNFDYIKNMNVFVLFLLSFISGILIYFGYNTYKKAEQPIARFLVFITCMFISIGILRTNSFIQMGLLFINKTNDSIVSLYVFYMVLFNALGGMLIPLLNLLRSKIKSVN